MKSTQIILLVIMSVMTITMTVGFIWAFITQYRADKEFRKNLKVGDIDVTGFTITKIEGDIITLSKEVKENRKDLISPKSHRVLF